MSALSWFDWRSAVALCGIVAAALLLIAWQKRQSPQLAAEWLGYSALGLELLGLALSVFWAVTSPSGSIMPVIFVAGWVSMLIGRAILIPRAVSSNTGAAHDTAVYGGLALAYIALYGSGFFHAVNSSSDTADARLESSLPAQALDGEIAATRQRLANLAGFADAGKAHSEEQAQQAAQAKSQGRINALQADLAAAKVKLAGCKHDHITRCITPAKAAIASLEAQLSGIGGSASGNGYASRHSEYNGLQAHLVELQKQRAALSSSGQGVAQAWSADDRAIAWLFGIEPEQANRVKWLVFTLIFDLLSLAFRVVSALIVEGNATAGIKRRLCALIDAGLSPQQAIAMLDGSAALAMTPAGVSYPHLDKGGRIKADGVAVMHAGEIVLNAKATAALDDLYPGLADRLNAGVSQENPATKPVSGEFVTKNATNVTPKTAPVPTPAPTPANDLSKPMTTEANDLIKPMTTEANDLIKPMTDKRSLSLIKCEGCGVEVMQRTVWQRFCPTCTASRKKGVLRTKKAAV
jgi:hypothetical protein